MRPIPPPKSRRLIHTLTIRLVVTTILAMLMQAGIVSVRDYFGETDFLNGYLRYEARRIARQFGVAPSRSDATDPSAVLDQFYGAHAAAYAFRVIDAEGGLVNAHNAAVLEPLSPWTGKPLAKEDFWLRKLNAVERMHVAGGMKIRSDGKDVWVELATYGDPAQFYLRTLAWDILNDVWVPMLPLVLLSLIVTMISVRQSLQPLVTAANRADEIAVLERGDRVSIENLPAEASHFASAINRLLDRVADLVVAQRLFIARAAHELRTPLSIMMLELGQVEGATGKRLEGDVRAMSEIVNQLLLLSRLEAGPRSAMEIIDVSGIAQALGSRMRGWIEVHEHKLTLHCDREVTIRGDETAVREALRNLIENAVAHTPPGTEISIEVTSDASIVVEDSGPGLEGYTLEDLQLPFRKGNVTTGGAGLGLAIVRQAVELHDGRLNIGPSRLGGARFAIDFPASRIVSRSVT